MEWSAKTELEEEQNGIVWHKVKLPGLLLALGFFIGILIQSHLRWPAHPVLTGGFLLALVWFLLSRRVTFALHPLHLFPLIISTSMLLTEVELVSRSGMGPRHLNSVIQKLPQRAALRGEVLTDPVIRERKSDSGERVGIQRRKSEYVQDFELRVEAVKTGVEWVPAEGIVLVRVDSKVSPDQIPRPGRAGMLEHGRRIVAEGVLAVPHKPSNFHLFDFSRYLAGRGIHHALRVENPKQIELLEQSGSWAWLFRVRSWIGSRLTQGIEDDSLAVGIIRGMLLGYREDIPEEVNEDFRKTGTLHVFAISGSHISLIALVLIFVLRQAGVSHRTVAILVIPILLGYVAATGLRASAVRSLLMAAVVIFGWSIHRPFVLMNNFLIAAVLILAWDPLQLFDPGFQLSFMVVGALILFVPPLSRWMNQFFEPDPYIPRRLVAAWRRRVSSLSRWVVALVSVSLVAWIGSLGLTLHYFNLFSLVSLPANLIITPLASLSVGLGFVSLILGCVWDELGISLNFTHAFLIHLMVRASEFFSSLGGYFYLEQPPIWFTVSLYFALAACFGLWLIRRRWASGIVGVGFCLAIASRAAHGYFLAAPSLNILDVGAGQCLLIQGKHGQSILIDAGSREEGRYVVKPFLRARGVDRIDHAFISHADTSHYGGFFALLDQVKMGKVYIPDSAFQSKPYYQLLDEFKKRAIPVIPVREGEVMDFSSGKMIVFWPAQRPLQGKGGRGRVAADDANLVLIWHPNGNPESTVLLASDASRSVEEAILSTKLPLSRVDLVVQGWDSKRSNLSGELLNKLKPANLVLTHGSGIFGENPGKASWERLDALGIPNLLRTEERGGLRIVFPLDGSERVQSFR
jgi:competence protein ComEC